MVSNPWGAYKWVRGQCKPVVTVLCDNYNRGI